MFEIKDLFDLNKKIAQVSVSSVKKQMKLRAGDDKESYELKVSALNVFVKAHNRLFINKAFRFKLEPNEQQTTLLYQMAGCGRVVFNDSLYLMLNILKNKTKIDNNKALYEYLNALPPSDRITLSKDLPSAFSLNRNITHWKKKENRIWLTGCLHGQHATKTG